MPKRSISQRTGDSAEHLVQGAFLKAPNWICRTQSHDYGIDLEAELANIIEGTQELSGALVKLQVKGTSQPVFKNRSYYIRLKTKYLKYANQCNVPVLLCLVNTQSEEIHYLWLQEFLMGREEILNSAKSTLLKIPEENNLRQSLSHKIPEIALGATNTSQLMAVQKVVEVFSCNYDQRALELASALLEHLDEGGHVSILNSAIDKLVKLGPHLSRLESQKFGKVLYNLTSRFGDKFDSDQILKMVVRREKYSIAGFDGLIGLYDQFPDHAKSLNLSRRFDELNLHELSWYCQFRDAHIQLDSLKIWTQITKLETAFRTRIGILLIPQEKHDYCEMKWPLHSDYIYLKSLSLKKS